MQFIFDTDESFSFETLRAVGYTLYGGADIGEVITTRERIAPGETEAWYREWRALADRIVAIADKCAADGHTVSANDAYLPHGALIPTAGSHPDDDELADTLLPDRHAGHKPSA